MCVEGANARVILAEKGKMPWGRFESYIQKIQESYNQLTLTDVYLLHKFYQISL